MQKATLTFFVKRVFVVLFFCAIQLSAVGQSTDSYSISTTNGTLRVNETPKNELSIRKETPYFGKYFRLVQFYSLPTDDERKFEKKERYPEKLALSVGFPHNESRSTAFKIA